MDRRKLEHRHLKKELIMAPVFDRLIWRFLGNNHRKAPIIIVGRVSMGVKNSDYSATISLLAKDV